MRINSFRAFCKLLFLNSCILLIFTIVNTSKTSAQNWASEDAKWTYTQTHFFSSLIDTLVIRSIGDTVIQGQECRILKRNTGTCDLRPIFEYMYDDGGRVFYFDGSRNEFLLLYDFNATAGQSYTIYPAEFPSNDSIVVTIDSVRPVVLNDVTLKKQFISFASSEIFWSVGSQGEIIENIGDTWSMFPWIFGACDANWGGPLRCYEDASIGNIDFGTALSCDYVTLGIETQISLNHLNVYPNPAKEFVMFECLNMESGMITISDIYGRRVATLPQAGEKTVWNSLEVKPGVYLYRYENKNDLSVGKFLISR